MFRPDIGLSILAAAGLALTATLATAQDSAPVILPLEATIMDIEATIQDMSGNVQDISAEAMETLDRSGDIAMRTVGDDVVLTVTSDVLFGFDSAELSAASQGSLTDIAALIMRAPEGKVTVVGHTDSKGSEEYNLELSQRRAEAVTLFLQGANVPSDRLATEGRGESEPLADNEINGQDSPDGRAKNRRVEFVMPKMMLQD